MYNVKIMHFELDSIWRVENGNLAKACQLYPTQWYALVGNPIMSHSIAWEQMDDKRERERESNKRIPKTMVLKASLPVAKSCLTMKACVCVGGGGRLGFVHAESWGMKQWDLHRMSLLYSIIE